MLHSRLFSFPIDKFGKFLKMSAKSLPLNKKTRISEHSDNIELAEAEEKLSQIHASRNPRENIWGPCIQKSKWLNKYSWGGKANIKPKTSSDTAKTSFPDLWPWWQLGRVKIGQVKMGQVKIGQVKMGQVKMDQVKMGQVKMDWVKMGGVKNS